jgi:hypothetical protein
MATQVIDARAWKPAQNAARKPLTFDTASGQARSCTGAEGTRSAWGEDKKLTLIERAQNDCGVILHLPGVTTCNVKTGEIIDPDAQPVKSTSK